MELSEFLQKVQQSPELSGIFVVAFQGKRAPSLFLSRFFLRAKESLFPVASLNADVLSVHDSKTSLEVSFLGSRLVYWIQGVEDLSSSAKKLWISYSKTYEGPHCMVLFDELQALTPS